MQEFMYMPQSVKQKRLLGHIINVGNVNPVSISKSVLHVHVPPMDDCQHQCNEKIFITCFKFDRM